MFPLKNMLNIIFFKASVSSASIFLTCNKPREKRDTISPKIESREEIVDWFHVNSVLLALMLSSDAF